MGIWLAGMSVNLIHLWLPETRIDHSTTLMSMDLTQINSQDFKFRHAYCVTGKHKL